MPESPAKSSFSIRAYRAADAPACHKLYREGLIGGRIAPNDTALDMDDIQGVYMDRPGSRFWVAEAAGRIVGMIGVQHHEAATAEIRRLRVAVEHRRKGLGTSLLEAALRFCVDHQYQKLTLDTYFDRDRAIALFEKHHFKLSRSRDVGDRSLLYFYFDLYTGETRSRKGQTPRGTP